MPTSIGSSEGAAQHAAMPFIPSSRGNISELSVGGKTLVPAHDVPPLFATVMESATYDGVADFAPRKLIPAEYSCEEFSAFTEHGRFIVSGRGALTFPGGDALAFTLRYTCEDARGHISARVTLEPRGEFKDRFIREVGLRLPLALDFRKRVVQAGDQGMRWDTRHFYQFHTNMNGERLLGQPDTNWWRHFYVDQESDHSYRLWRAESPDTGGLHALTGRRAAGWMTLYDRTGGVLFAYRGMAERAPKTLCANAEGGGEAVVYFHSPTCPAMDPRDLRLSESLFGAPHKVDFIFFNGEEAEAQSDRLLAKVWGVNELASDGPTRFEPIADELNFHEVPASAGELSPMVAGAVPIPRGAMTAPNQARLFAGETEVPCQTKAIAFWPDRSIKWLLLVFPLDGSPGGVLTPGKGEGDDVQFQVTLRNGPSAAFRLQFGKRVRSGKAGDPLKVSMAKRSVTVKTGPLAVTLSEGERWMTKALLNGREMLRNDGNAQAAVDFVRTAGKEVYPVGTTHPDGAADPGPVRIDRIDAEESGPLRAVIRLEGRAMCQEPAKVIMRLEFYRGRSFVRLTHTVEFMQKDPREAFVRRIVVRLPLSVDAGSARITAGGQNGPVNIALARLAGLLQTSHLNYQVWRTSDNGRYRDIVESYHASRGWLDVTCKQGGVAIVQRGMWKEAPKDLLFDARSGALRVDLWPGCVPLMDVRRYSNYPHRSQGESVSDNDMRWVVDYYYGHDPFVGVTRTHETLFFFHGPDTEPAEVDSVAADFNSQPLVYAGWPWYAKAGVTFPLPDPDSPGLARFNAAHQNVFDWWMWHQKNYGWYGFWDFGDTRHKFRSGYGRILPVEDLEHALALPAEAREDLQARALRVQQDYYPQTDWAFDNGRWGWSNAEGLANLSFSMQYLRTGKRDLFFFMEANARHVRDVDARHDGLWFGKGTRHGVQHWSDGNHEERQTTFTEQRMHYLLTGEPRTREWCQRLTDGWYLSTVSYGASTHSARSYGLFFNWEITGDARVGTVLRDFMHVMAQPGGISTRSVVVFPQVAVIGEPGGMNEDDFFFHSFGAMHAVLEYYYLTGDERVRDSLIKMAEVGSPADERRKAVAFAARHAADSEKFRRMIEEYAAAGRGAEIMFQQVPSRPEHWTGPKAFLIGDVSGGLFWLCSALYVAGAMRQEPKLSPEEARRLEEKQSGARLAEPRAPRESWQAEYDNRPALREYLSDRVRPTEE